MQLKSLDAFLRLEKAHLAKGPIAIMGIEDDVEVSSSLRHLDAIGFKAVIALMPDHIDLPPDVAESVVRIDHVFHRDGNFIACINKIQHAAKPGTWFHYCYNAEYLFFPFCETRSVGEMLAFHTEERRDAMLTFVVDLYAGSLADSPNAVSLETAHLDRSGYYALAREEDGHKLDRQLDFFGGLRWRFEEHVPSDKRRIDRISLFRANPRLTLRDDFTFDVAELNTVACPWHHNISAAVCSFRTAKALKLNPGSRYEIETFRWHNSAPFEWHSQQLLDLGLMEPGQWF